jgi:hypothetical protein
MKFLFKLLVVWMIGMLSAGELAGADTMPPAEGGVLPDIVLAVPPDSEFQEYLGLAGKKTFTIPEIKAEVVIIEIFSMY